MDFRDTADEAAFRTTVRSWVGTALAELPAAASADMEERRRCFAAWQSRVHAAGYAGLSWPEAYGGRGAGVLQRLIWAEELDRAGAPEPLNGVGEGFAGPTIIAHGTEEQRQRFLPPILRGEEIWCQLFSEPGAGSDLAALQTRAERCEGGWRITGQKVWTSRAQIADYGILLARTSAGRHDGITYFLLPMRQEGVTVRPLVQMTGDAEFNEVFLDGAFVADDAVLGTVDDGWRIARATLQFERESISMGRFNVRRWVDELVAEAARSGRIEDPLVRQRLAELDGRARAQRLTALRAITRSARGAAPGPKSSVGKLYLSKLLVEIADFGVELSGAPLRAPEHAGEDAGATWQWRALFTRGMSLAGGTPNIQRNIVAERVLGLPRG